MEPSSPTTDTPQTLGILEAQIRECFGRVVYSNKIHEKCADELLWRHAALKNAQIAISALASGSVITAAFTDSDTQKIIAALLSTGLLGINLYFKNYNFGQLAEAHKETAAKLWLIRESYFSLIADMLAGLATLKQVVERRDKLQKELGAIYSNAPRTNSAAYRKAQDGLKYNEEMTFADAELDVFLPAALRKEGRMNTPATPTPKP